MSHRSTKVLSKARCNFTLDCALLIAPSLTLAQTHSLSFSFSLTLQARAYQVLPTPSLFLAPFSLTPRTSLHITALRLASPSVAIIRFQGPRKGWRSYFERGRDEVVLNFIMSTSFKAVPEMLNRATRGS